MNRSDLPAERSDLDIAQPCPKRWAELEGGGARRFCGQCSLHVVDGAALTRREAEEAIASSEGRICMRLLKDADGQSLHRPEARRSSVVGHVLRYGLTAAAGVLAACGDERKDPVEPGSAPPTDPTSGQGNERPIEIMGDVCYPVEPIETVGEVSVVPVGGVEIDGVVQLREDEAPASHEVAAPREMMGTPAPVAPPKAGSDPK